MSAGIKIGNFLYRHAFPLYRVMYGFYKKKLDQPELNLLRTHIKSGDHVLDIGANIGFYSRILAEIAAPHGKVHTFEPDPVNFRHLSTYLNKVPNVICNNMAVGASGGEIDFYLSNMLNVDHRAYEPESYDRKITVPVISIDDYLDQLPAPERKINFIKMDIQGFEPEAIKGMHRLLSSTHHISLLAEFWPYGLRTSGHHPVSYFDTLVSYGFNCELMDKDRTSALDRDKVMAMSDLGKEHYFNIFARKHV